VVGVWNDAFQSYLTASRHLLRRAANGVRNITADKQATLPDGIHNRNRCSDAPLNAAAAYFSVLRRYEPYPGIEPGTFSLPWKRSTD
jgi:hypothetical protein